MPQPTQEVYLTVAQVATRLHLSTEGVRIHLRSGDLPGQKAGPKKWLVTETDLQAWLANPVRKLAEKSVSAKRLLRTILKMDPEELDLAADMLDAARSLYNLESHTTEEVD